MVNPVPNYSVTTAYHKSGSMWTTCGWHTGQDYAAPAGTRVVAARAGTTKHVNYGSSFGNHQIAVQCDDGTEDFYAHMSSREASGKRVDAGAWVGYVGTEGNSTGNHLHFERHKKQNTWNCDVMDDPMISHNDGGTVEDGNVYVSKLVYKQDDSDSVSRLQQRLNEIPLQGGTELPITGGYFDQTKAEVKKWQEQKASDKSVVDGSKVTDDQADQLFSGSGNTVIHDTATTPPPTEPTEPPASSSTPRWEYVYTGKPSNTQDIGTSYGKITDANYTPPGEGILFSMLYFNVAHTFDGGEDTAGLRVRAERESPSDYTGYGDYTLTENGSKPGEFVMTHIWFEKCDADRRINWQMDRAAQFNKFTLGTRYSKWLWISTEKTALLTSLMDGSLLSAVQSFMGGDAGEAPIRKRG